MTVVGDDFQAIYGFRAASARHILEFPRRFPDAHAVTLERNYRSTAPILAVANAVSEQDRHGFRKTLWSEHDGGSRPELVFARDEGEQARRYANACSPRARRASTCAEQAVLFRTSHDSDLLEIELTRRGIPFVKYGGLRYLEAAHVKDLIALLRLADNPADEVSWFRVLQLLEGVGPTRARRVLDALRPPAGGAARARPLSDALAHIPEGSRERASALIEALAAGATIAGIRVERLSAALAPLVRLHYPDGAVRLADLDQLVAGARGAEDLRHFVAELVLDPPASSADLGEAAASRRGLPGPEHRALGEGPRVGDSPRDRRLRRQLPG